MDSFTELLMPVLVRRYPDKTPGELDTMIKRLKSIGMDEASIRYQVEHGML